MVDCWFVVTQWWSLVLLLHIGGVLICCDAVVERRSLVNVGASSNLTFESIKFTFIHLRLLFSLWPSGSFRILVFSS